MRACAAPRRDGPGTWISEKMITAYSELHRQGWAHSIEVSAGGKLVGGLYGVAIGRVFYGESMFAAATDASKTALATLVWLAHQGWFDLIDCQMPNPHLTRLGAQEISRKVFETKLFAAITGTDDARLLDASAVQPGHQRIRTDPPPWAGLVPGDAATLLENDSL